MTVREEPHPDFTSILTRIESSAPFARAARARQLLRHLCEKTLAGRASEIKESTIAAEVFRRASYDPQIDSLVRVEMSRLRKALDDYYSGEGKSDPHRIEIPKGGYVPVFTAGPGPTRAPRLARRWIAAALFAACLAIAAILWKPTRGADAMPTLPAFAVLPFQALEGGPGAEESARRVSDDIVTRLSRIGGIRVLSSTATAQEPHAVVEGSVSLAGDRIRIATRLRTLRHGVHFWTSESEGALTDQFEVERKAAKSVEQAFPLEFAHVKRALVRQTTQSPEAFYYYLRASHLAAGDLDQMREALSLLRAAEAADPSHVLARAAKAQVLSVLFGFGELSREEMAEAEHAVADAIRRDPRSAEVQRAAGNVRVLLQRDWTGAESAFQAALSADPAYPQARYDYARLILTPRRRFDQALAELDRALALAPSEIDYQLERANTLIKAGRPAEALRRLEAVRGGPAQRTFTGMAAFLDGRIADAEQAYEASLKIRRGSWTLGHYGYLLAVSGRGDQAELVLEELRRRTPQPLIDIAAIEAGLGRPEAAIQTLDAGSSLPSAIWIDVDFRFASLRDKPEYQAIRRRLGLMPLAANLPTALRNGSA